MVPVHSDDFEFAVARAQLGFAALDAGFTVRERRGALSNWLPEVGRPGTEAGLLFAMEPVLEGLRESGGAPLVLPSIGLPESEVERVNISISCSFRRLSSCSFFFFRGS